MIIVKKLRREDLVKILNERKEVKKGNVEIEEYKNFLNDLEAEINNHLFEIDNRFVTYGRRNFLKQQFEYYLNNNKYFDAFINLEEYILGYTSFLTLSDIPQEETRKFHDVLSDNDDYFKDGIICLQEKNIIIEMISEFKDHF